MAKTSVKFSDIKKIPPMMPEREVEIKAFRNNDFSDNAEWTVEDWKKARPVYTKIAKADVHTRIDQDILNWLKHDGRGYQARLNAALRFAMNHGF